jgi:8-oxo-dGTP diphosphatase
MKKQLQLVSAAIIRSKAGFLVCKRPAGVELPGHWEFPGGKVKEGENPREALRRELKEELGITARIGKPVEIVHHRYDFGSVLLLFFEAEIVAGKPLPLHHDEIHWVRPDEIEQLDFLPADLDLISRLVREQQ